MFTFLSIQNTPFQKSRENKHAKYLMIKLIEKPILFVMLIKFHPVYKLTIIHTASRATKSLTSIIRVLIVNYSIMSFYNVFGVHLIYLCRF